LLEEWLKEYRSGDRDGALSRPIADTSSSTELDSGLVAQ
jgi:hypothetical protein